MKPGDLVRVIGCALLLISLITAVWLAPAAANDSWGEGACLGFIAGGNMPGRSLFIVGSHQVLGLQDTVKDMARKLAPAKNVEASLPGAVAGRTDILYLTPFPVSERIELPDLPTAPHVLLQDDDYFQGLDFKPDDAEQALQALLRKSICGKALMRGSSRSLQSLSILFYADQRSLEMRQPTRLIVVSLLQAIEPAFGEDRDGTFSRIAFGKDIRAELAALVYRLRMDPGDAQ